MVRVADGHLLLVVLYDYQREDLVRYICEVLYAVLYARINCFVVRGCALSRMHIHFCNSVINNTLTI